jgi:hypothetical protein
LSKIQFVQKLLLQSTRTGVCFEVESDGRSYSTPAPIHIARFAPIARFARITRIARFAHLAPLLPLLLISHQHTPSPGAAEKRRVVAILGAEKQLCRQRRCAAVK